MDDAGSKCGSHNARVVDEEEFGVLEEFRDGRIAGKQPSRNVGHFPSAEFSVVEIPGEKLRFPDPQLYVMPSISQRRGKVLIIEGRKTQRVNDEDLRDAVYRQCGLECHG